MEVMRGSGQGLMQQVASLTIAAQVTRTSQTVGTRFRDQLKDLITRLDQYAVSALALPLPCPFPPCPPCHSCIACHDGNRESCDPWALEVLKSGWPGCWFCNCMLRCGCYSHHLNPRICVMSKRQADDPSLLLSETGMATAATGLWPQAQDSLGVHVTGYSSACYKPQ